MSTYLAYEMILEGADATLINAQSWARGFAWGEVEASPQAITHARYCESIAGVGIWYDYAGDYYFFTDEDTEMEQAIEMINSPKARNAFQALKAIGAPVLSPDLGWGGHFAISAEAYGRNDGFYPGHIDEDPDGLPWAEYYWEGPDRDFGVSKYISNILAEHDLFCEWVNAGVLAVYDA